MRRCGNCGSKNLKVKNIKGTTHPWRDFLNVELLNDQDSLVCLECETPLFSSKDLKKLDKNILSSVRFKIDDAIRFLTATIGISQETLAAALGITPEYLSMIKNHKRLLSFSRFNLLQCFRLDPSLIFKLTGIDVPSTYFNIVSLRGMNAINLSDMSVVLVSHEINDSSAVMQDVTVPRSIHLIDQQQYADIDLFKEH